MKFIFQQKLLFRTIIISFLAVNGMGYGGSYLLTHYQTSSNVSFGIPRPKNYQSPADFNLTYISKRIPINEAEWLDTWLIKANHSNSLGTVILFHGKGSTKSSLLASAKEFHLLNYDTLLVDFRGAGDSSGNKTTIGVKEAEDVTLVVNYLPKLNLQKPVILYGISMGSAAILRAIAQHNIQPDRIILELPFVRLLNAVKNRLKIYSIPSFIMGELFVFWGGLQHGFNGFAHNPVDDAKVVNCPTLILSGKRDPIVDISEVEELYHNLDVKKNMVIFPEAGHQLLVTVDKQLWLKNVRDFLN